MITERRGSITTHAQTLILPRKIGFLTALAGVPVGVGALVGRRSPVAGIVAGGLTALALGALRWQLQRWWTEEPEFQVMETFGPIEVRKIRAHVEARVHLEAADWDSARERGFHLLAKYIFGGNAEQERLAMLAPVIMTRSNGGYELSFVMPANRTLMSLPRPADGAVTLREAPERRVAVKRFRGGYTGAAIERDERQLRSAIAKEGLTSFGPVTFAGFDPPWTLGLLKRTELWLDVE